MSGLSPGRTGGCAASATPRRAPASRVAGPRGSDERPLAGGWDQLADNGGEARQQRRAQAVLRGALERDVEAGLRTAAAVDEQRAARGVRQPQLGQAVLFVPGALGA